MEGGPLVKSNRAYKSAKRNKELDRIKKREEKRLRRLAGGKPAEGEETAVEGAEGAVPEGEGAPDTDKAEPE